MTHKPTIVFAGGGTGGHIFPNLAILEALQEKVWAGNGQIEPHFVVSDRRIDADICEREKLPFTPVRVSGWSWQPLRWATWWKQMSAARAQIRLLLKQEHVRGVVATGGFVSFPVVAEARALGKPVALVNLDAVPGRANRWLARRTSHLFTVYPCAGWSKARHIGPPLRRIAVGAGTHAEARAAFGLEPDRLTLLVVGGSQGATTIDQAMAALVERSDAQSRLRQLQILHISGQQSEETVRASYAQAGFHSVVLPFVSEIGQAWRAATIAVSRAGAGSVAEAWANAVPTIFLPYPFHRDQHQKHNAQPLVDTGGAITLVDHKDAIRTSQTLRTTLLEWLEDESQLKARSDALRRSYPEDGLTPLVTCLNSWLR